MKKTPRKRKPATTRPKSAAELDEPIPDSREMPMKRPRPKKAVGV